MLSTHEARLGAAPAIFDMDIGTDPDDTCVAALLAARPSRFQPALLVTSDETREKGRARFLSGLLRASGVDLPVAAGLPSLRRRTSCLVEEAGLAREDAPFSLDAVGEILRVLDAHPRVDYVGLGPLTNLDAVLGVRPELAARVRLFQMGPALSGAYRREAAQYNARLDPGAFARVLCRVEKPRLLFSHSSWGTFGEGLRQRLGVYPDDPLACALRKAHPAAGILVRHLEAWVGTGKDCSIMHDPLTVLSAALPGLVDFEDVSLLLREDGWVGLTEASHAALGGALPSRGRAIVGVLSARYAASEGRTIEARMSLDTDDEAARRAIAEALLGEEGARVAEAWGAWNREREAA
ncbi:nucleoside hydrolase [Polyangium sp. y55x31]|uniref:nucleoside hydrolase n=1 Tax=Polyangium sp. y55x31 TaxID=3042688 RepID=UPI0024828A4C|nr:nucleoside hydrolase [Polyangium sp. y55x31]MDI1481825.1 nucleoside hydrolase [Polyangium sp. y55x31]